MPVTAKETFTSLSRRALFRNEAKAVQTPSRTEIGNGQYNWFCTQRGTMPLRECLAAQRNGSYYKKSYSNVPYLPSIHNKVPLPYVVRHEMEVLPTFRGLLSLQAISPGAPLVCPATAVGSVTLGGDISFALDQSYAPVTTALQNAAIADLHDGIASQKAITTNWGVFLGERRDSMRMIGKRLTSLLNLYSDVRNGRLRRAYSKLFGNKRSTAYDPKHRQWRYRGRRDKETLDALWLEWSYGWSPLMGDIYHAYQDLFGTKPTLGFRVKGSSYDELVQTTLVNHSVYTGVGSGGVRLVVPIRVTVKKTVKVVYWCTYRAENTLFSDLTASGILDPVSVAWELVPFSFVVDWFANIGDVLRGLTITNGLTFLYGSRSVKQTVEFTKLELLTKSVNGTGDFGMFKAEFDGITPDCFLEKSKFERTVLGSSPMLRLSLNHEMITIRRAANAAALIAQLMRRRK